MNLDRSGLEELGGLDTRFRHALARGRRISSALRATSRHRAETCGSNLRFVFVCKISSRKLLEKSIEFGPKFEEKSLKIEAPGALLRSSVALLAPRWPKMRFVAHLGLHLDGYWGASWRQDGPRWRQVGQLGAKMCPRWPTWVARLPTWRTFGSTLVTFFGSWARSYQKWRKPKKRREFITFEGFLGSWGCSWRLCWAILALCWAILALCWLILALC